MYDDIRFNNIQSVIDTLLYTDKVVKKEKNIIDGMSYGGLAAGFMAFHHPDIFGKVLGQSSSFWRDFEYKTCWFSKIYSRI